MTLVLVESVAKRMIIIVIIIATVMIAIDVGAGVAAAFTVIIMSRFQ